MSMETNLKNRFVAYYRVSTEKQDLESQRFIINNYIDKEYICAEFCEIESGKHMSTNEQLGLAVEFCKDNNKILVVALIDRLGRDAEHALKIHRELDGWLYSCNIPGDLGAKMDRFTLTLFMAFAEKERELISIRTKMALKAKKEAGVKLGPKKPLSDKKVAARANARYITMLEKKFNDPKYHVVKDFILKRVREWEIQTGRKASRYYNGTVNSPIFQEVVDELNALGVEMPDYLQARDKFVISQIINIYRDETSKVKLQYQLTRLKQGAVN